MVMANLLAIKLGLLTNDEALRIKNLLEQYDIPTRYKIEDVDSFYEHFFLDKKALDNKIKFILPVGIGNCKITNEISKDLVIEVLKEFN
jgi:3-dehydroquinate synthase